MDVIDPDLAPRTEAAFMKNWVIPKWPVLCVIAAYWVAMGILIAISIHLNQGKFVYPLDDSYIHMAIAKNTVQHGVWGVTKYEFSNSTSSPLWTGLLAITYLVFGVNEISPLGLNLFFGTLALIILYFFIRKYVSNPAIQFAVLLTALFVTPLPSLTLTGMEHIPHIFLTITFLYLFMALLPPTARQRDRVILVFLSGIIPVIRYEGLILVFVVCIIFALQRRIAFAALLGVAALLPVTIYGFWSISRGWYFIPNGVLIKGNIPGTSVSEIANFFLGFDFLTKIQENVHVIFLLLSSLLVFMIYLKKGNQYKPKMLALAAFIGLTLLHIQLADTGWFYRYEAYIVFSGIAILGTTIPDIYPKPLTFKGETTSYNLARMLFLVLIASPFGIRAYDLLRITPDATNNIYEQQYQMGLFLAHFYQGQTIAANDIGAINYLADIRLLDLWGLGSIQVAELRLQKHYNTNRISTLARDTAAFIALVYEDWYEEFGGLPAKWLKVGSWEVSNNVVLGGNTVSFYAVDLSESQRLIQSLKAFRSEIPQGIKQYGIYTQQ